MSAGSLIAQKWKDELFNNPHIGVVVVDKNRTVLDANQTFCDLYGCAQAFEIIGEPVEIFHLSKERYSEFGRHILEQVTKRQSVDIRFQFKRKDDSLIWVQVSAHVSDKRAAVLWTVIDITEQVIYESQLVESEAKFRLLAEHTHDWEYWLNLDGQYQYISPACEKITGYGPEEFFANRRLLLELIRSDFTEKALQHYEEELDERSAAFSMEFPIIHKNGEERWLEHNCRPIFDEHGRYVGRRGNNRDITERKSFEKNLLHQQLLLEKSQKLGHIGAWEIDFLCAEQTWTDETYRIFGIPIGTKINVDMLIEKIHPDDRQYVDQEWNEALARGIYQAEFRIVVDGKTKWVRESAELSLDKNSKPFKATGFVQDVTASKQAKIDLSLTNERFDRVLKNAHIGVTTLSEDGTFTGVNPFFCQLLGYSEKELLGMTIEQVTLPEDFAIERTKFENIKDGDTSLFEFEKRFIKKDGQVVWTQLTATPVFDHRGKFEFGLGLVEDITAQKSAEEQRLELEEQLRQKYKMEAVGLMAGGIAHNFNNNLAVILGNMDLAKLKLPPQVSEVSALLDDARIAVLRSRDLVQQILTYSRKGSQEKKAVQISLLVEETIRLLRSTIPSTVALACHVQPEAENVFIRGDATRIQEALFNLCSNAVHAIEEKGQISISLETLALRHIDISAQYNCHPGDYVRLSVQDTGRGMTTEIMRRIFDPFFTTKDVHEGTGMGLASVQGVVDQHDGMIKVLSAPGKGATFELYFPLSRTSHVEEKPVEDEIVKGKGTVLFVDDDEMLVDLGKKMLSQMGYQVIAETDSRSALQRVKENPVQYDLVITDQTMPDLDGKGLSLALHQIRPDLPIILCTGYSSKISKEEARVLGIDAFLMKPIEMSELSKVVRRVLDSVKSATE